MHRPGVDVVVITSALAVEDSHHGVTAAMTAGMRCVAAPGPITRSADFAHASIRVESLSVQTVNPACR